MGGPRSAVVCGAGAAGAMHALVLRTAGVRICGVYDPDPGRARALAEMHGAEVYASEAALFRSDASMACVTSPPPLHVAQAEQAAAARAGRIVFVEKPLAVTKGELARLARVPGCVPIVQWRAGRALRAVRAAIAQGELGPAPSVSADLAWSRDAAYFAAGRGTLAAWGCGVLLSVGVHAIDAICWAMGRPLRGARGVLERPPGVEIETRAAMLLTFDGGGLAAVRATFDAGPDATCLAFAGGGVTATIRGGELDPTASAVEWSCTDDARLARLRAIEEGASGATAPPLLVPFLRDAVAALDGGAEPGACDALPGVRDVWDAHAAILDVYLGA
jgi:predicted dehydrogenase